MRMLTHRAIDRRAGLPEGTTSRYARTRQALLSLIVDHLAERSLEEAASAQAAIDALVPAASAVARRDQLVGFVASFAQGIVAREDEMRARFALLLELPVGSELHARLGQESVVQAESIDFAESLFARFGVKEPRENARRLVQLTDGLAFTAVAGTARDAQSQLAAVVEVFVAGLPLASKG